MKLRLDLIFLAAVAALSLDGCATQPHSLYYWGDYQAQVYEYLKSPEGGDVAQQVAALEEGAQKAAAENKPLPPGYHAQLGMLYLSQGRSDQAVEQLALEKAEYPESGRFMDRLLKKFEKQ